MFQCCCRKLPHISYLFSSSNHLTFLYNFSATLSVTYVTRTTINCRAIGNNNSSDACHHVSTLVLALLLVFHFAIILPSRLELPHFLFPILPTCLAFPCPCVIKHHKRFALAILDRMSFLLLDLN